MSRLIKLTTLLLLAFCNLARCQDETTTTAVTSSQPSRLLHRVDGTPILCGTENVSCVCGIGENRRHVSLDLEIYGFKDSATGKLECNQHRDPYQACANISCFFEANNSSSYVKTNGLLSYFYPQVFSIPAGDFPEGHRLKRQFDTCQVTTLKNAAIKCWKWPNWMNCDINCMHGYALRDSQGTVTTKNVNCRDSENVWKPHGFQDCEAFLNCKVKLVKPGNLKCKEPIDGPAYCDISCLDYGEFEAKGEQKYECVDDAFAQSLPHCATLQENVPLIPKPH